MVCGSKLRNFLEIEMPENLLPSASGAVQMGAVAIKASSERRLKLALEAGQPPAQGGHGFDSLGPGQRTFPDDGHSPIGMQESFPGSMVPCHVGTEFCLPEACSGGWIGCGGTSRVTMPKATMDETDGSKSRKYQIRCSREFPVVKPVSEAESVEGTSQRQFGFSVLSGDRCHHSRSDFLINYVSHGRESVVRKNGPWANSTLFRGYDQGKRRRSRRATGFFR